MCTVQIIASFRCTKNKIMRMNSCHGLASDTQWGTVHTYCIYICTVRYIYIYIYTVHIYCIHIKYTQWAHSTYILHKLYFASVVLQSGDVGPWPHKESPRKGAKLTRRAPRCLSTPREPFFFRCRDSLAVAPPGRWNQQRAPVGGRVGLPAKMAAITPLTARKFSWGVAKKGSLALVGVWMG